MTRGDRRLLLILVVTSFLLFAWRIWGFSFPAQRVVVIQDGKELLNFDLKKEDSRIYKLRLPGGEARLEVKEGAVRILPGESSDFCPERICVQTGWITKPGESIVCAPNKLVIRITSSKEKEIDALSR